MTNNIEIRYATDRSEDSGRIPIVTVNGRSVTSTYRTHGYCEEDALAMAADRVKGEAEHYAGDWDISVECAYEGSR